MKRSALALLASAWLCPVFRRRATTFALDVSVPPGMQSCANDADCTMVDGQCGNACSFVPMNRQYASSFDEQKKITCGEQGPGPEAQCVTQPALNPTCVNHHCTVGAAWQEHADASDYLRIAPSRQPGPPGRKGQRPPNTSHPRPLSASGRLLQTIPVPTPTPRTMPVRKAAAIRTTT